MNKQDLIKELNSFCKYNPDTGKLIVTKYRGRNSAKVGQSIGFVDTNGRLRTSIKGRSYYVARLIWLLHTDSWPEYFIDHIDQDRLNNRIENLRDVDSFINNQNKGIMSNNTSRVTGVSLRSNGRWRAWIRINKKLVHLGTYTDFNIAVQARYTAEKEYGFSPIHGV